VRAGDGETVGAIVARAAPGDVTAIADGRAFVGRRRAIAATEGVAVGDEVTVAEAPPAQADVTILARGDGWAAVDKPAGLPTIPDQTGSSHALVALAARALAIDPARLHPTSRLDRDVSGVVVFALDRLAAERLQRLRDERRYERRYLAIASRAPAPAEGSWRVPIGRASNPKHRAPNGADPVDATTHYSVIAEAALFALLALAPVTGRTHQLRVHASHAGAPLLGDRAYGGPRARVRSHRAPRRPGHAGRHGHRVPRPREAPCAVARAWRRRRGMGEGSRVLSSSRMTIRLAVASVSLTLGVLTILSPLAHADKPRVIVFPGSDAAALRPDAGTVSRIPPDPPPLVSRKQWVFDLRWSKGDPYLLGVRQLDMGAPQETQRAMGRFAIELFEGPTLIERVRFDFPLLGPPDPADAGYMAPPSFQKNLTTRIGVMFPVTHRGTRLELWDRATDKRWPLPWPPEQENAADGGAK
jgi:23S rRNA-/tRNA-specific pseudouridylate synthase